MRKSLFFGWHTDMTEEELLRAAIDACDRRSTHSVHECLYSLFVMHERNSDVYRFYHDLHEYLACAEKKAPALKEVRNRLQKRLEQVSS